MAGPSESQELVSSAKTRTYKYEEALNLVGFGKFQYILLLFAGMGYVADNFVLLSFPFIKEELGREYNLPWYKESFVPFSVFTGMLPGAFLGGIMADRMGRRPAYIASFGVVAIAGLLAGFIPSNFALLNVLRAIQGVGAGAAAPLVMTTISEFCPAKRRGMYLMFVQAFYGISQGISTAVAALCMSAEKTRLGWHWYFILLSIPSVLAFGFSEFLPESPRYLLVSNRKYDAQEVLYRAAMANGRLLPQGELQGVSRSEMEKRGQLRHLFTKSLKRISISLYVIHFASFMAMWGLYLWLPNYLHANGSSVNVYEQTASQAGGALLGALIVAPYIDRVGRRVVIGTGFVLSGLIWLTYYVATSKALSILLNLFSSTCASAAFGALMTYTNEVYPTTVRSVGQGVAYAFARVGGMITPSIGVTIIAHGTTMAVGLFSGLYIIAGLAAFTLPTETASIELEDTVRQRKSREPQFDRLFRRAKKKRSRKPRERDYSAAPLLDEEE